MVTVVTLTNGHDTIPNMGFILKVWDLHGILRRWGVVNPSNVYSNKSFYSSELHVSVTNYGLLLQITNSKFAVFTHLQVL
jgi:hypothetical protein